MRIAIIVVAYNRPEETYRLMNSICAAEYGSDIVDLIVDIDKGEKQDQIVAAINDILWTHGEYRIVTRQERMGLRPHVFACGSYTEKYDAVIVLEDDLIVAQSYYFFARKACERYKEDCRISQISLYSYAVNEFEARPFYPAKNDADVFAMQVVQSWGECWTKDMWNRFKASKYYFMDSIPDNPRLHDNINSWKNSWKKVFFNYLVETDSWVIYPYCSLTSNYSNAGEHRNNEIPGFQVVIQSGLKMDYIMPDLEDCIQYDSFFERIICSGEYNHTECCLDLYGSKHYFGNAKFVASSKALPFRVLIEYGLTRKPHEENLVNKEPGKGILVYDLSQSDASPAIDKSIGVQYDLSYFSWKRALRFAYQGVKNAVYKRIRR